MNKLKTLISIIKGSMKAKIIAGTVTAVVVGTGAVGTVAIVRHNENVSQEQVRVQATKQDKTSNMNNNQDTLKKVTDSKEGGKEEEKKEVAVVAAQSVDNGKASNSANSATTKTSNNNQKSTSSNSSNNGKSQSSNQSNNPAPSAQPTPQQKPSTPPQNYDQVTGGIPHSNNYANLIFVTDSVESSLIQKYSLTNFSDGITRLMRSTTYYLSENELSIDEARQVWVNKYVANKYKVLKLNYFEVTLPDKGVEETEESFVRRVKEKGLFDYKPSGIIFDDCQVLSNINDNSTVKCVRLVIEMEHI